MEDEVGVVSEVSVEGVVLEMRRVQVVSSELIASVLANDALEVVEGEEVRVVPAWSLEGNRKGSVEHLVVSLVQQGRSEVSLV